MQNGPFSAASADARLSALLDAPACFQRHRALLVAEGEIGGRPVVLAANDPSRQRGAIGIEEGRALAALFAHARAARLPAVLVLDSSGARVDEDLPALGAFRILFREALHARLAGVRMFALLGSACFGGASLLASLCARRSYLPTTLLAASGPRVIASAQGSARFDAHDPAAVRALLGSAARRAWHAGDGERADTLDAARAAVRDWLDQEDAPLDLPAMHAALQRRLPACAAPAADAGEPAAASPLLASLLPRGYAPVFAGRLVEARADAGSGKPVFVGAVGGAPLDAGDSMRLAALLLRLQQADPAVPLVLLLDADAHAASVADESVLLSDYLVHLSLIIAERARAGHRVALWILGRASGASYVAFAAAAHSVSAAPDAGIEILPPAARASIVGTRGARATGTAAWLEAGVADALLEQRQRRNPPQPSEPSP